jgi:hypothetical protein
VIDVARQDPEARKEAVQEVLDRKHRPRPAGGSTKTKKAQAAKSGVKQDRQPGTVTLPIKPAAFVRELVKQLGPEKALGICRRLCQALGLEAKEKSHPPATPPVNSPQKGGGGKKAGKSRTTRNRSQK